MCTAVAYRTDKLYFGRTLDYECSFGEEIVVTPRHFPLSFRECGTIKKHYAMVGMAHVEEGYPLYYDAVNEKGLAMAGLNFVGNAVYSEEYAAECDNIAQFEFLPWVLSQCSTVGEVRVLLKKLCLRNLPFSADLPIAALHWMIADCKESITVEAEKRGLRIYENPVGVLTNNPPFEEQMLRLNDYMQLSAKIPQNRFSERLNLQPYSRGMGAIGLPGDVSSPSRFVRAAFLNMNSRSERGEMASINQTFHILQGVEQVRGCCELEDGRFESTIYTACMSAQEGDYYYTTYGNHQIGVVRLMHENLDEKKLMRYQLILQECICEQNKK